MHPSQSVLRRHQRPKLRGIWALVPPECASAWALRAVGRRCYVSLSSWALEPVEGGATLDKTKRGDPCKLVTDVFGIGFGRWSRCRAPLPELLQRLRVWAQGAAPMCISKRIH